MNIDQAREYIVILNGGSGCLMQPLTGDYTYILTAKHNIVNNNNALDPVIYFKLENEEWILHEIKLPEFVEGEHYFPHPNKDIALIKIPPMQGYDNAIRLDQVAENSGHFYLLGYPESRRNNEQNRINWYRRDAQIQIFDPKDNGLREAGIPGNATIDEVRGDSGGGIVKVLNGYLYIAGIQNRMAAEGEGLGRIHFTPLKGFDEIIEANSEQLAPLQPCYLSSFRFLENDIFNLTYGALTKTKSERLSDILKVKAREINNSGLTPYFIRDFLQNKMPSFYEQEEKEFQKKKIWSLWLELLTILNIAKNCSHNCQSFPLLIKKIRLFYSNVDEDYWIRHLPELHKKDYSGLEDDGIIIVATNTKAEDGMHVLDLSKIPADISRIKESKIEFDLERLGLNTTVAIDFPLEKYKFMNISAFKEGAASGFADQFAEDEIANCLTTLRILYGQLISN